MAKMGGARPGAGAPPTNLDAVVRYRPNPATGEQVGLTVTDIVVETMSVGGFLHDAAARVGVAVETLRRWRTTGNAALADLANGTRRLSDMKAHERRCITLVQRMDDAEAEARTALLQVANGIANGGGTRTETTVKLLQPTDDDGAPKGDPIELERTTRTIEAAPDGAMVGWLLSHRWPADFNRNRVEITGEGGGPVLVDATPALEKIARHLADIKAAREETAPDALEAALANGNGSAHNP